MGLQQIALFATLAFFGLEKNICHAEELKECTEQTKEKPFLLLTEFNSNQILGQDSKPNTRQVLNELLRTSLMRRTTGGHQSVFFSSWKSNDSMTKFDFVLNDAYKDEAVVKALEKAIQTTILDSGLVVGAITFDEKKQSFHIESNAPRPRLFDYLTQIYPSFSEGPYKVLCQKFDGTVLRLKRVKIQAGYPEFIDVSTNAIDYDRASLVLSSLFADDKHGFYDNHVSKHRTNLVLLDLNANNKAIQSGHFRKLLSIFSIVPSRLHRLKRE